MYSIVEEQENIKKAKGMKKNVVKKEIQHEQHKEALYERKQFCHGKNILRNEGHYVYGIHVDKFSLSAFDMKRWIEDEGIRAQKDQRSLKENKGLPVWLRFTPSFRMNCVLSWSLRVKHKWGSA